MCLLIDAAWALSLYVSISAVTVAGARARDEFRALRRTDRRAHARQR